ncbi:hypothetical protein GN156_32940, partial [bacterium LRH843]|nr:hypothetical protein [bacterium LRH843]
SCKMNVASLVDVIKKATKLQEVLYVSLRDVFKIFLSFFSPRRRQEGTEVARGTYVSFVGVEVSW